MAKKKQDSAILDQYKSLESKYSNLGKNIVQALELFLKNNKIPYLSINYRVKDGDSFIKKIERKKYAKPFDEIEDICGIRIICYYQSDVVMITNIIKKEFLVGETIDKGNALDYDQFGYRSTHLIVQIKKEWLVVPNYRGLENLKAEIQIRTVLMHGWAEIEHKLAYKSESQIPKEIKRKLSRVSAKLEEADEQFEEIKIDVEKNKEALLLAAKKSQTFDSNIDFNLDNLQTFLDYAFPDRNKMIKNTSDLFEEMQENKLTLKELIEGYYKVKDIIPKLEKESFMAYDGTDASSWAQVGAARTILELINTPYFNSRKHSFDWDIVEKYRKTLQ